MSSTVELRARIGGWRAWSYLARKLWGKKNGGGGSFMTCVGLFHCRFSKGRLGRSWLLAAPCSLVCHLPGGQISRRRDEEKIWPELAKVAGGPPPPPPRPPTEAAWAGVEKGCFRAAVPRHSASDAAWDLVGLGAGCQHLRPARLHQQGSHRLPRAGPCGVTDQTRADGSNACHCWSLAEWPWTR